MRSLLLAGVAGLLALTLVRGGQAAIQPVSLQEQIDGAQPGDTLLINGGTYNERVTIDKPLSLQGEGSPVIDGGGQGDVVTITGDEVTLSGFTIRNSGRAVSQEPAAIKVNGTHNATIERNRIESSHFGVHVTDSHHTTISSNEIDVGGDVAQERRGHAIYLWEVSESIVHSNVITNAADGIHLEFSDDNGIGHNTVMHSRYAIHLMSSHNNRILNNMFSDNLSGALLMFSNELLIKDNVLSNNRAGASGAGMLLKDVNNIFVEGNVIQRNRYGINAEGTPNAVGASAIFIRNTLALNDTGVGLFSNAPITFVENSMIENFVQVEALSGALQAGGHGGTSAADAGDQSSFTPGAGGPDALTSTAVTAGPVWSLGGAGNYWSDYAGYDKDGDGVGDQAYRPRPPFAGALAGNPTLRLFQFTLAQEAIDMAADMFPVYEYKPVIEDSGPLMTPPGPTLADDTRTNGSLLLVSILLLAASGAIVQFAFDFDPLSAFLRLVRRPAGHLKGSAS
jgi:nitrous oxidase accessory protein